MPTRTPPPAAHRFGPPTFSYAADPDDTPSPLHRRVVDPLDRTVDCAVEVVPVSSLAGDGAAGVPPARAGEFPRVGATFLGFALDAELGSGAFGKVFLARQLGLAGRPVALKVTTRPTAEPAQLAKLHHTNIVPIYSVHDAAPLQAVCMPYLGARTLADLVVPYLATGVFPASHLPNASTKAHARTTTTVRPNDARPGWSPASAPGLAPRPAASVFDGLSAAEQVEWVLRTVRGVAEGLAHAHGRGVLHLDLKPANVLIADDGTALLLDFNLSKDLAAGTREQTGGTLPYMAPEQLDGFRARDDRHLDERTDLFALGVIFYELLTGRHPFPRPAGAAPDLARMAAERRAGPARLRAGNPAVPYAVESIVTALLQPLPARRYPSAAALAADLARQLEGRPLAFAREPSPRERLAKWRRRNPRLGSRLRAAALVVAVAGLSAGLAYHADARADAAAAAEHRQALAAATDLRVELVNRADPARRAAALKASADLLGRYGLTVGQPWGPTAAFRRLPAAERLGVATLCGELCRLNAAAVMIPAHAGAADEARGLAEVALAWNVLAGCCYADASTPRALHRERNALLAAAGRPERAKPDALTDGDEASELYLAGVEDFLAGRHSRAVAPLEHVAFLQPGHAAAQFLLAVCRHETGDSGRALERYLVVKALDPASGRASVNRGVIALLQSRYADAEGEFADALGREPGLAVAYKLRGVARQRQGKHADADADLTRHLELEPNSTRGYRHRAEVRAALGDAAGAEADRLSARRCTPETADDFVARGGLRAADDAAGAERDFRRATGLDPRAVAAWQNLAHLAAGRGDLAEALALQNKAVAAAPESAAPRLARALLLVRLGRRDRAHADARAALELAGGPVTLYQAARVFALTSPDNPDDADRAVELVRAALRAGYRDFDGLAADPALAALRGDEGLRDAVLAARAFWSAPAKVPLDD